MNDLQKVIRCINIEDTKTVFGYGPEVLSFGSRKSVVYSCEFCFSLTKTAFRNLFRNPEYIACISCTGTSRAFRKQDEFTNKHEFWKFKQPKINLDLIDIEESKKVFGYKNINVEKSLSKKVIATCEFCRKKFTSKLTTIHKSQKYVCCHGCSYIASIYESSVDKHEFYLKYKENQELKIRKVDHLVSLTTTGSDKCVDAVCEFCLSEFKKKIRNIDFKRGTIACSVCASTSRKFNRQKETLSKHDFWKNCQLKSDISYIDIEKTKIKYGHDPSNTTSGSHKRAVVKCQYCGDLTTALMSYLVKKKFRKSCKKCAHKRGKETMMERYGVQTALELSTLNGTASNPLTERIIANLLNEVYKIEFVRNFEVPIVDNKVYSFDFFIPSINLLIECQGDYFHNFKENGYSGTPKDRAKSSYIESNTNYKLVHVWEHEIHLGRLRKIFNYHINNSIEEPVEIKNKKTLEIKKIIEKDAHIFLSQYHYLGNLGTVSTCYGAFYDSTLVSVATFGGATRQNTIRKVNKCLDKKISPSGIRELRRFCIRPNVISNRLASYLIKKFTRLFIDEHPGIQAVISFADSTVGDIGSIYKYSGWSELPSTGKSYHYLDPKSIKMIHKKTVWDAAVNAHMSESEFCEKVGLMKIEEQSKSMWIICFDA